MSAHELRLDSFLPYRLSVVSNLVSEVISQAYSRLFALSVPEWRLVAVIAEADGLTQQEIGARTRMDKVTVSRAASALANRAIIKRLPNPIDGRSHVLSLTEEGAILYRHVAPLARDLERRIFGEINSDDLDKFCAVLQQIDEAAKKLTA